MKTNIASIPITLNNITIEITEQRIPTTIFNTKPVIANDAENMKPMIFKPMDNKQIANKQERTVNIHITPFILFIGYNYYMVNYPPSKDGWACNWLLQYRRNLLCRFSWTLIAGILPSVPLHHRVVDSTRLTAFRIYRNLSLLF